MTLNFLTDFASIFLLLALVAIATAGWGYALARLCGLRSSRFKIEHIWLGLCVLLASTTLINYLVPLDWKVFVGLIAIGIALLVAIVFLRHSKPQLAPMIDQRGFLGLSRAMWVALCLIGCFLTFKGMHTPRNYDSGLYHFNSIRWLNEYPMVAGLGLLHERLAFNSSWFELPALLNIFPYFNHGYAVAMPLILLVAIAHIFQFQFDKFKLAGLSVAILLLGLMRFLFDLPAPTPDTPIGILQIIVTLILIELVFVKKEGVDDQRDLKLLTLVVLCATMVTIKLSGLVFAALSLLVLIPVLYHILTVKRVVIYALVATIILIPHLLRGYFLSGAPLFPSTAGAILTFDWAMSKGAIENTANWVYCWARKPGEGCMESLENWNWVPQWWEQFSLRIKALGAGSFALIVGSLLALRRARLSQGLVLLYLYCAVNVSTIIFWFFTAPDQRFLGSIPYTFLAVTLLAFMLAWEPSIEMPLMRVQPVLNVLLIAVFAFFTYHYSLRSITSAAPILQQGFLPLGSAGLVKRYTTSGLGVYQPASGDRCFDSPLPCSPGFDARLRLIQDVDGLPRVYFTTKGSE